MRDVTDPHDDLFSAAPEPATPEPAQVLPPAYPDRAAWGTATHLRAWQSAALEKYFSHSPRDFLAVATPGAGKTTFALTVAAELLARRVIDRITIVAPTEHLKTQWAEAASRAGIPIDPTYAGKKGPTSKDYVGVAVTYAGNLELHERGFPGADSLRALIVEGRPDYGMSAVGEGMDSPASALLIAAVDRQDSRPLWVPVWGGPNVLAQALWKVRATRTLNGSCVNSSQNCACIPFRTRTTAGPGSARIFPTCFTS